MRDGYDFTGLVVASAAGMFGGFLFLVVSQVITNASDWRGSIPLIAGVLATAGAFASVAVLVQTLGENRRSSERQLRAYLVLQDASIAFAPDKCTVALLFKNSGQTPAYKVRIRMNWKFAAVADKAFNLTAEWEPFPDLGPGMTILHTGNVPLPNFIERMTVLAAGSFVFYDFGEVEYTDAFGKIRKTYFNCKMKQTPQLTTGVLDFVPEGTWST